MVETYMAALELSEEAPVSEIELTEFQRAHKKLAQQGAPFKLLKGKSRGSHPDKPSQDRPEPTKNLLAPRPDADSAKLQFVLTDPHIRGAIEKSLAAATQCFIEQFFDLVGVPRPKTQPVNATHQLAEENDEPGKLRSTVAKVIALIEEAHDVGVSSVQDLKKLMTIDQDLAGETPPAEIIKIVNDVDLVRFGILLTQHRKLHELTETLRFATDLSSTPFEALIRASQMAAIAGTSVYAHLCPAQAVREATRKSEDARALISAFADAESALAILGFDRSSPASCLEAVYLAAMVASRLPSSYRDYFIWSSSGGAETFQRAIDKWTELVRSEAEWVARLPGYAASGRPSLEEVEALATQFSLVGKKRLRTQLAGVETAVQVSLARLGFDPQSYTIRDELEALLAHLRAVRRFCTNATYTQMFGSSWAGLDTPFDQIAAAILKIRNINNLFKEAAHGSLVFNRLIVLEVDQLDALASLSLSTDAFRMLSLDLKARLDERAIDDLLSELIAEQDLAASIVGADSERLTADISVPLSQVYDTAARENLRRELSQMFEREPLAPIVEQLNGSKATGEAALKAVAWVSAINRNDLPPRLRSQLLSENVAHVRDRVRDFSNRTQLILKEFDDYVAKFEQKFENVGLSFMTQTELLAQVDRVIEQRTRQHSA